MRKTDKQTVELKKQALAAISDGDAAGQPTAEPKKRALGAISDGDAARARSRSAGSKDIEQTERGAAVRSRGSLPLIKCIAASIRTFIMIHQVRVHLRLQVNNG